MIIAYADTTPREGASPHRGGGIAFRYLLAGDDGTKDNFAFMLVETTDDFATPRHRHNFEQVRIMLEGAFEYAPGKAQTTDQVGYFCEGTYYTQKGVGRSLTLLLQIGGASGEGYMSSRRLRQGAAELQETGTFEDGVYTWRDAAGGRHNLDGYEAIWQHVNGRKLVYPAPRYDGPVMMNPESFAFVPLAGQPGASLRALGVFNERGLALGQLRLETGARFAAEGAERPCLYYATEGRGTVGGEPYRPGAAFKVERGETVMIEAEEASRFHRLGLPVFDA